jgi:hypothetical protein
MWQTWHISPKTDPQFVSSIHELVVMPTIARLNNLTVADPYARPVVWAAALTGALLPLALYAYSQRSFISAMSGAVKM